MSLLWAKIGTQLPRDIKIRKAGHLAELLYIRGILHSKEQGTDGVIEAFDLPLISVGIPGDPAQLAEVLVTNGLWVRAKCNAPGAETVTLWRIPAKVWAKYHKSKAQIDRSRNKTAERVRKHRAGNSLGTLEDDSCNADGNAVTQQPVTPDVTPPEKRKRKRREREEYSCPEPQAASGPPVMLFPVVVVGDGPTMWPLPEAKVAEYRESFPGIDVLAECRRARQWCIDNRANRKTYGGMPRFLSGWLGKEQNKARPGGSTSAPPPASAPSDDDPDRKARIAKQLAERELHFAEEREMAERRRLAAERNGGPTNG